MLLSAAVYSESLNFRAERCRQVLYSSCRISPDERLNCSSLLSLMLEARVPSHVGGLLVLCPNIVCSTPPALIDNL